MRQADGVCRDKSVENLYNAPKKQLNRLMSKKSVGLQKCFVHKLVAKSSTHQAEKKRKKGRRISNEREGVKKKKRLFRCRGITTGMQAYQQRWESQTREYRHLMCKSKSNSWASFNDGRHCEHRRELESVKNDSNGQYGQRLTLESSGLPFSRFEGTLQGAAIPKVQ